MYQFGTNHLEIMEVKKNKYLIALPGWRGAKGFNHQTILVSGTDEADAINLVYHIKRNSHWPVIIGDIKQVDY